ncbi:alpha/beta fold hydrolase [Nocardioides sp.]|uniref:alpha/beta fold hydrolase n=1 Tax=Nocardioides sp. TaxID=35761 RepID=UPI0019A0843E|nr:alpha/beta fold hydrolase [Nocardioides sp.]MBC7275160.1 alpha/beta fold hydrolase [Nocardioides sp.]
MTISSYVRDGLTFDVIDSGPAEGDPVVLLHGFPERATCWREVSPILHDAGFRAIAPDQRGYSPGARPRTRLGYRAGELVEDVVALIDEIGRPVHLAGHDWGSAVGWGVAAKRPDLVRSWTAMSVPHPVPFARSMKGPQLRKSAYMAFFNIPFLPELVSGRDGRMERMMRGSGWNDEDVERFREEIVDHGALPGALGWYRALPLAPRVGRVSVPTTMLWSDGDVAIGRSALEGNEDSVTGPYELVELAGVSHWIPTKAPEAAASAILGTIAKAA